MRSCGGCWGQTQSSRCTSCHQAGYGCPSEENVTLSVDASSWSHGSQAARHICLPTNGCYATLIVPETFNLAMAARSEFLLESIHFALARTEAMDAFPCDPSPPAAVTALSDLERDKELKELTSAKRLQGGGGTTQRHAGSS